MDLKALFETIYAYYNANTDSPLPLYNTEAPAEAEFSYVTFQLVSNVTDEFASNKAFTENNLLQFNVFDRRPAADTVAAAVKALTACFDFAVLTVAGYAALSCVREGVLMTRVDSIWMANITYRVKLRP